MTYLFVGFLVATALPLFLSSWRVALAGLSLQAVLMAALLSRTENGAGVPGVFQLADIACIRAVAAPLAVALVLLAQNARAEFDLIPTNLIFWALAATLVILAYWFAHLASGGDAFGTMHVGASASAVLLGLFILSNQARPFGQVVGILFMESGVGLLESLDPTHLPLPVMLTLAALYLWLLGLLVMFLKRLPELRDEPTAATAASPQLEWETL